MVDRQTRDDAFKALKRFLNRETTNDDYESEYPLPELFGRKASEDAAIKAIHSMSWNWFDDFKNHKLEGKYELEPEIREIAERCCQFLTSNCEYLWRESNFMQAGFGTYPVTTLGLIPRGPSVPESLAHFLDQSEGDASVWPFFSRSDFEFQQQNSSDRN